MKQTPIRIAILQNWNNRVGGFFVRVDIWRSIYQRQDTGCRMMPIPDVFPKAILWWPIPFSNYYNNLDLYKCISIISHYIVIDKRSVYWIEIS